MQNRKGFLIFILLFVGCVSAMQAATQVSVAVNSSDFGFLGNYGTWVNVSQYGRVWRPHPVADWRPFSRGDWARTDQGWTWNSSEPYGWAVYHYGNWTLTPNYGWVWIPGYEWSPARVQWMYYGDYAGWAPLPMAGVHLEEPWVNTRYWSVVPVRHLTQRNIYTYRIARPVAPVKTVRIVRTAPDFVHVERVVNHRIDVVHYNTTEVQGGKYKFKKVEIVRSDPHKKTVVVKEQGKTHNKKSKEKHHNHN